jgi:hypothetical protein
MTDSDIRAFLTTALGLPAPEAQQHLAQADAVAAASGVGAASGAEPEGL